MIKLTDLGRLGVSASSEATQLGSMAITQGSKSTRQISVAIDGPAGAGKSTTARMLAGDLGFVYVDSGAMYRAVAWKCGNAGVAESDTDEVIRLARDLDIRFKPAPAGGVEQIVLADNADITKLIRTPQISQVASSISAIPEVREVLVAKQRALGEAGGVVMEGRDIGTVVLPDAEVKIFLTASLEERARRRFLEMEQKAQPDTSFERVRSEMAERDERDTTRAVSPLMPASDAVIVDSEEMTARQVVDAILDVISAKRPRR